MTFGYVGIGGGGGALLGAGRVNWLEKMPVWSLGGRSVFTVRGGQLRKQKEWERWLLRPASRPI